MAYSQFKRIAEDALKKTFAETLVWSTSAHSHVCYVFNSFWNRFMRLNKTPVITVYCISTRGWSFYAPPPKKINPCTLIKRRCSPMTSWWCDTWKAKTNYCSPLESPPYADFNHCLITVDSQLFNVVTKAPSLTYIVVYPTILKFEKSIRQFFLFLFFHFTT